MERTVLTWNVPNIVSVWLMAATGFLVAGLLWQLFIKANGGSNPLAQGFQSESA